MMVNKNKWKHCIIAIDLYKTNQPPQFSSSQSIRFVDGKSGFVPRLGNT